MGSTAVNRRCWGVVQTIPAPALNVVFTMHPPKQSSACCIKMSQLALALYKLHIAAADQPPAWQ